MRTRATFILAVLLALGAEALEKPSFAEDGRATDKSKSVEQVDHSRVIRVLHGQTVNRNKSYA